MTPPPIPTPIGTVVLLVTISLIITTAIAINVWREDVEVDP